MSGRVLCVDPYPDERAATAEALRAAGFDVTVTGGLSDARAALDPDLDCVVTETGLADGDGLDLIAARPGDGPRRRRRPVHRHGLRGRRHRRTRRGRGVRVQGGPRRARERLVAVVETTLARRTRTDYPLPADEESRLSALATYDLDDPGTRRALDRLTTLAVERFGVEMASVNVIGEDERRLLACEGLDLGDGPRGQSVCTFTILEDDVTVVEDVRTDPRFEDVTELRESAIRAYAGAPFRTPEGTRSGRSASTTTSRGRSTATPSRTSSGSPSRPPSSSGCGGGCP